MTENQKPVSAIAKGPLVGLLLLIAVSISAQQMRFKEPQRKSAHTHQIVEDGGTFYAVGQIYNSRFNRFGVNLLMLD